MGMRVGDIVIYKDDWKLGRKWVIESIYKGELCKIVLIREGKTKYEKNGREYSNPSIVNLDISRIKKMDD